MQESNRIEFKQELNDKLEKEIVAFLNNQEGGVLYIGLDNSGYPVSNLDVDKTQLKIADRIKNNILPATLGLFDITTETVENVEVVKVIVSSGLEKPYYIKKCGMSPAGCYMRIGTSTQPMTTSVIDELYGKRIHTTLRNITSPRQDLTFAQLKIYYQEKEFELDKNFARSLELLTPDGKYNYVAYLLADENGVSMPRNRELMRVFKDVELVEQLGSGMGRILQVYTRSVFHISEHFIKVVLPLKSGTQDGTQDERLIKLVKQNPKITRAELAIQLNTSPRTVQRILNRLANVKFVGSGYSGHWSVEE